MHPILFKLGPITIYTYGFFIFLGVVAAYLVCSRQAKKLNIDKHIFSNIFFAVVLLGFIGGRVFYILVELPAFLENPLAIGFGRSGFVFYGGVFFVLAGLYFSSRKYRLSFLDLTDIFAQGAPLAHAFGRLGCFFYGCCYGRPTLSVIGLLFPPDSPAGIHRLKIIPTQLISFFFLLLIFGLLLLIRRKKRFKGQIFLYYLVLYGTFRFAIEFIRADPRGKIFTLSPAQVISLFLVAAASIMLCCCHRLKKNRPL